MQKRELFLDISNALVSEAKLLEYESSLLEAKDRLESGTDDLTGWVKLPLEYDRSELKRIIDTAAEIRAKCQVFVVIGIGGSYLGARAAIEMLRKPDLSADGLPQICFAGQTLSAAYHLELIDEVKDKEICICVISKSGTTTETNIAFSLFKELLIKKYGIEEAKRRIYIITDEKSGMLRKEAEREGYISFAIPGNIGGRYSVLTPVGLLPVAVAGINVMEMLDGAAAEADICINSFAQDRNGNGCRNLLKPESRGLLYAAARNALFSEGKIIEIFEYFEPKLHFFTEWLKQLFGESEGKGGKGIFPAALQFSTDLHSMGQFLQEGNQVFLETILNVTEPGRDLIIPESAGGPAAGKSMNTVNRAALEGVIAAHRSAGIPLIKIDIPSMTAYDFGQMVYFFEWSCALSGCLAGLDPFDQPGVERYKSEMRNALKKR